MDWSLLEVEAVVSDYLAMLALEIRGQPYNKTEHRRALLRLLDGRTEGSIERKHQNISAVLRELGMPWIDGYKPLSNYQDLLFQVVEQRLAIDQSVVEIVARTVDAPAEVPSTKSVLDRLEEPPDRGDEEPPQVRERPAIAGSRLRHIDYLAREARNASLGLAGEQFVLAFERERLARLGREQLAERVEHVSVDQGDGAGFDIRSFEADGTDRLIEVKATAYGKRTPFYVSRTEVAVSSAARDRYHLYRLFKFRTDPRLYTLRGAIEQSCLIEPMVYSARPA